MCQYGRVEGQGNSKFDFRLFPSESLPGRPAQKSRLTLGLVFTNLATSKVPGKFDWKSSANYPKAERGGDSFVGTTRKVAAEMFRTSSGNGPELRCVTF